MTICAFFWGTGFRSLVLRLGLTCLTWLSSSSSSEDDEEEEHEDEESEDDEDEPDVELLDFEASATFSYIFNKKQTLDTPYET